MKLKQLILVVNVEDTPQIDITDRLVHSVKAGDYIQIPSTRAIQAQIATAHLASEPSEDLADVFAHLVEQGLVTGDQISNALTKVQSVHV